ncbi:MAG: hypothetical protein SFV17_08215 [Candidatus Obscuribacter sp.]|nr:hypothetical protein [Candidatus Melainabacteria bacterium]MDX1986656.1 hypothetical protein [Candidatus Obscuribacter sp.]
MNEVYAILIYECLYGPFPASDWDEPSTRETESVLLKLSALILLYFALAILIVANEPALDHLMPLNLENGSKEP